MKKIIATLVTLAAATTVFGAYVRDGAWLDAVPNQYESISQHKVIFGATEADLLADGWTEPTAGQIAAHEADVAAQQEAAAQAAMDAEAQAKLPQTFPTGIAVTNAAGHWVEFVPDGTNVVAQTLAIQVSQSPLTPEQREAMKAAALADREAKRADAKAAKQSGQLQRRIAALEALLGIE